MRRAVVVLAAAWGAACFTKPGFLGDDDPTGDGGVDAVAAPNDAEMIFLDAPPPACTTLYSDTFAPAAGDPCGPWGVTATPSNITISRQGVLAMTLPSSGGGSGGCVGADYLLANTVSIQLVQALTSPYASQDFTVTGVQTQRTTRMTVNTQMTGPQTSVTMLRLYNNLGTELTAQLYDATAMKWLRLEVVNATAIKASYSADGTSWTELGVDNHPGTVGGLGATLRILGASAGSAHWDELAILNCPAP